MLSVVQGVFYRDNTIKTARALGLLGWVRNLEDSRVELVAEGPRAKLEALVKWCHTGSPKAVVSGVDAQYGEATAKFTGFKKRATASVEL